MNYSLNKKILLNMQKEQGHTELEKNLMDLAIRLYNRIGKVEKDKNEIKFLLYSIQTKIFNTAPWVATEVLKNFNKPGQNGQVPSVLLPTGIDEDI